MKKHSCGKSMVVVGVAFDFIAKKNVPSILVCPQCSRYGYEKSMMPVKDLTAWANAEDLEVA